MYAFRKPQPAKMLVIYMIMALLFLTSFDLHIHDQEAAATADHGFAVSISALDNDLMSEEVSDEITVSPDGVLKVKQSGISLMVIFLLVAVILNVLCRTFIGRLREGRAQLPFIPFHGTPPLRAPPL